MAEPLSAANVAMASAVFFMSNTPLFWIAFRCEGGPEGVLERLESLPSPQFTGTIGDFDHVGCCPLGTSTKQSLGPLPDRSDISNKNQELRSSTNVLPILAGEGDTLIPADSIAAILDSASPLPPEMMAPA